MVAKAIEVMEMDWEGVVEAIVVCQSGVDSVKGLISRNVMIEALDSLRSGMLKIS